tara:strand:- start:202 stop:456 length:255 start_codon:yes stop_codon:yes gene_type:complete
MDSRKNREDMKLVDKYDLNISEDIVKNDMDIAELSGIDIKFNEVVITYTINYTEDYLAEVVANRYNITEDQAWELIEKAMEEEE